MSDEDRLEDALDDLAAQGWDVTREGDRIVHIRGTFANPERIALTAIGKIAEQDLLVYAANRHGSWALAGWKRPDSVMLTYAGVSVRWRHRRLPDHVPPHGANFMSGQPSPYDITTKPKHLETPEARAVLSALGADEDWLADLLGEAARTKEAARLAAAVAARESAPARAARPRTPRPSTSRPAPKPEPQVAVCPRCFMQLSATGVCGNCD
ncbi:MAG: hypothetical protein V9G04_09230 [Nocardioides sp.]|jgi:hypothetical protein